MKVVIDIDEKDYNDIMFDVETSPRLLNRYEWLIAHGTPVREASDDCKNKAYYRQCNKCGAIVKSPLQIDDKELCPCCGLKIGG